MGKHLPELIERYERVPAAYRRERDGEGLTVDERLVQGLDAAHEALDELGRKLAREDMRRLRDPGPLHREPLQGSGYRGLSPQRKRCHATIATRSSPQPPTATKMASGIGAARIATSPISRKAVSSAG